MTILFKGKRSIDNFFEAVSDLKEINMTAYWAYLFAALPEYLANIVVESKEKLEKIEIEHFTKKYDRHDIVITTNRRIIIIEAKMGFQQSERQVIRYIRNSLKLYKKPIVLCLLDYGSYKASSWLKELKGKLPRRVEIIHREWSQIHQSIARMINHKKAIKANKIAYYIACELKNYMEVNGMSSQQRKDVYVRDLQGDSIELFFKYKIYKSQPEFYKSAEGNSYFAPYFTKQAPADFAAKSMVKIERGISWLAPILDLQILKRRDIQDYLKSKGHPEYKKATKEIFSETSRKEMLLLYLGDPFLAFLTPVSKKRLNIHGSMGSRSFSFKELYEAAAKGD